MLNVGSDQGRMQHAVETAGIHLSWLMPACVVSSVSKVVFVLMLTNSSVLQICNVHELNYDQGQWDVSNIVLLQIQDAKYQVRCISKDKACLLVIPVGI